MYPTLEKTREVHHPVPVRVQRLGIISIYKFKISCQIKIHN